MVFFVEIHDYGRFKNELFSMMMANFLAMNDCNMNQIKLFLMIVIIFSDRQKSQSSNKCLNYFLCF